MSFQSNLDLLRNRIGRACLKTGRSSEEVQLIAVTKMVDADRIIEAVEKGIKTVGENKIQEALPKIKEIEKKKRFPEWHFIGKLQRNKVRFAVGQFSLIHSVDSLPLAEEISRQAEKKGIFQNILMEINLSGEFSKGGFPLQEALDSAGRIHQLDYVKLTGLMTIPPLSLNPEESRPFFKSLKALGNQISERLDRPIEVYSMGMSNDFEVAIEEGATHVRIGRLLFGERSP
ncbi:MAG: YggS family pyridoxal phosphate-dependent enzyme [Nitrospiria bacterium]